MSYKKITLNLIDLKKLFKKVIIKANNILTDDLLFNMSSDLYSNINLIQYANFEDFTNTDPYKCFANFHSDFNTNSLFLYNYIINNNNLKKKNLN